MKKITIVVEGEARAGKSSLAHLIAWMLQERLPCPVQVEDRDTAPGEAPLLFRASEAEVEKRLREVFSADRVEIQVVTKMTGR